MINLDYNSDISKTIISGGKYNEIVLNKVFNDSEYITKDKALREYLIKIKKEGYKDKVKEEKYNTELVKAYSEARQEKFCDIRYNHPDPYARLLAISHSNVRVYEDELNELEKELGVVPEITALRAEMEMIEQSQQTRQKFEIDKGIKDFITRDINRSTVCLNDVLKKNSYVLIEFWASWCPPCRREISYMKKAYQKYKNKGFEIISFTIDHEMVKWKKATKEEGGIPWINAGDLLARKSPVVELYGVGSIPANYLVDQNGIIIAKNLRREKLEEKLKEIFE